MRERGGFGDNVRGGCWESRWAKQARRLPGLLAGVTYCWVGEPREWVRSTKTLIYSRWLKSCRFLYYNPNENIFDNTNAYTWSWSEATILTSPWGVEISYEISLNLTFFICKWRHQYVLCGVFVVLKWNMCNISRIQCLETGALFPFLLYTYRSNIGSFLILIELCHGVVCEVKLKIKAEQRACVKIYYLILWDGLFGYFRTREKSLLYASYKWDSSWAICFIHGS